MKLYKTIFYDSSYKNGLEPTPLTGHADDLSDAIEQADNWLNRVDANRVRNCDVINTSTGESVYNNEQDGY